MYSQNPAIRATQAWIDKVVVGLNFCPFAKREVQRQSIRYVLGEKDSTAISQQIVEELHYLDKHPEAETTLIIYESVLHNFEDYLDVLAIAEALIQQGGYAGLYQVASFHPDYVFAGEDAESASNYTNRSPLPVIHILRESSLTRVLNTYSDPESIPDNNMQQAARLGKNKLAALLAACSNEINSAGD